MDAMGIDNLGLIGVFFLHFFERAPLSHLFSAMYRDPIPPFTFTTIGHFVGGGFKYICFLNVHYYLGKRSKLTDFLQMGRHHH